MGIRASACVLYGVDVGDLPSDKVLRAADAKRSGVEFTHVCGEGVAQPCSVLFARGSYIELVSGYDVPVPVLDVATIGQVDASAYRAKLRAFCTKHALPWTEPRWLIVSDVA